MAQIFRRHDLVRVDPAVWAAWLGTRPDLTGVRHLKRWAETGRPLIVRRRMPGEGDEAVPLGLPLPPADGKRRIGLFLPSDALAPMSALGLDQAADYAPAGWHSTITALLTLGRVYGFAPRPFGSLLWQAVTGLTYLSASSDLDLLWPCPTPVPAGLLAGLDAVAQAAPMSLDGEILLADGAGLHWRELRDAPEGGAVLAKSLDGVALRPVASLREPMTA